MGTKLIDELPENYTMQEVDQVLASKANALIQGVNGKGYGYTFTSSLRLLDEVYSRIVIVIPNNNNVLYDKLNKEPLRIYDLPLFMSYPEAVGEDVYEFTDKECIVIKRSTSMHRNDKFLIFEKVDMERIENLDFFEVVQRYRWMYGDE